MRSAAVLFALVLLTSTALSAQWLNHPTPGIPRTSDGKPDLTAPAPRGPDGRPDLSGLWRIDAGTGYNVNIVADLAPTEICLGHRRSTGSGSRASPKTIRLSNVCQGARGQFSTAAAS